MKINLWIKFSIGFLIIATFLGAFLRFLFVDPISGINFKYFLHAHSHIAFLGWIFNALYAGLLYSFLPVDFQGGRKYNILFYLFVFAVLGMMFSFPVQGYGAVSISFSTLHVFLSYLFTFWFIRDTNRIFKNGKPLSLKFAYWSLLFLVLSSLGPFALGFIMAKEIEGPFYQLAIYFYLHLQYDGWFTFAVFALIFDFLERHKIKFKERSASIFLWIFVICCLPTYANLTLWTSPPTFMTTIALVASIVQLAGIFYFFHAVRESIYEVKRKIDRRLFYIIIFALACFVLKNILQLVGVEQDLAILVYTARNFLIFYLHLIFLGFITVFLIAWLYQFNFYRIDITYTIVFIVAFILSELLLIAQPLLIMASGLMIPHYFLVLFIVSIFMPLSLFIGVVTKG